MISKTRNNIEPKIAIAGLFLSIFLLIDGEGACAFDLKRDLKNTASIGMAYSVHIFLHELGHQLVADDVGAVEHKMNFFTSKNGTFYPGLSQYKSIPEESKLPYAIGGERMSAFTFEYALQSYREEPTMFNRALMFFSSVDFLAYTVLANYVNAENDMYDPNLIRSETGMSKELMLSFAATKLLLNTYKVMNEDASFVPMIEVDKNSALFAVRFTF